jgi:ParB-like chromosome segregation protein Spo0J
MSQKNKMILKESNVKDLIPADYNPRQLSIEQFDKIQESLTRFGFVDPVIVNTHKGRENIIVGGHQRVKVWQSMGNKKVPTVEVDLPIEKEKELNVRLNKASGDWDWDMLANAFNADDLIEWGFTEDELQIKEDEPEEQPEVVFSEYLGEANNYVVLKFNNEIDWLAATTHFELSSVHSKRANGKPWSKGIGRVIDGAEYLNNINNI